MFIDKVKIFIKAGDGGNGVVSFLHASGLPNGGPDGGNGGKGGDVVFVISNDVDNLVSFHYSKHFRAGNGENGSKRNRNGKDGKDIYIYVPKGTVIRDAETNKVIEDMLDEVRYNAKCEIALNMLIITNLSLADIAEVTGLTVDEAKKIGKDANKEKIYI